MKVYYLTSDDFEQVLAILRLRMTGKWIEEYDHKVLAEIEREEAEKQQNG